MARTPRQALLDEAIARLASLGTDQLKVANEFLDYLQEQKDDEETVEILRIPGILDDIKEALADLEKGKVVRFAEIRRDV